MNLKDYLKLYNITKLNFSESLGISNVSLSRYISGERLPEKKILKKIF
jgi:Helix-turn-helix.